MLVSPKELVAAAKAAITETDVKEFYGSDDKCVLIDIRDRSDYDAGHLAGAVCSPRGMLEFNVHDLIADATDPDCEAADQPIVLYCGTGARSALAAQCLETMGYRNVRSIAGGVNAWKAADLPLEGDASP